MKDLFSAVWAEISEALGPSFQELAVAMGELWDVAWPILKDKWESVVPEIQAWFGEFIESLWDNEYVRYAVYAMGVGIALMLAPILLPIIAGLGKLLGGIIGKVGDMLSPKGGDAGGGGKVDFRAIGAQAAQLIMMAGFLWAITELVLIPLIKQIDDTKNLTPEKVMAFSLLLGTMLAGAGAASAAAAWVGKFSMEGYCHRDGIDGSIHVGSRWHRPRNCVDVG